MEDADANGLGEAARRNLEEKDCQGEDNNVPLPRNSPRNSSTSSKTVKIEGKTYQIRKQRINKMLQDIEENASQNHSEHLEKQAALLSNLFNKINFRHLTAYADTEPDFLEIFGETEDQMNDWKDEIEACIEDLIIRASREVSERKAATQSGFKKLSYPHFNGDILNYLEFKKQWAAKVLPERKPQAIELVALRDSIPASAKAKIADVTSMDEAWRMLDLEYGDIPELRAKLKDQVRGIKIKYTKDSARIVELFHQIQIIAVKIKATGNLDMLENEDEYIALVSKHLPKDVMWKWWESDKSGWSNFYLFLEGITKIAKKQQTSESIMSALSGEGEKTKCS